MSDLGQHGDAFVDDDLERLKQLAPGATIMMCKMNPNGGSQAIPAGYVIISGEWRWLPTPVANLKTIQRT